MHWIVLIAVVVALLGLVALIGFVRSIIRLFTALIAGILFPGLIYFGVSALDMSDTIPLILYVIVGIISALGVLLKG